MLTSCWSFPCSHTPNKDENQTTKDRENKFEWFRMEIKHCFNNGKIDKEQDQFKYLKYDNIIQGTLIFYAFCP